MRRLSLKLVLFVLLGAIVNVAVAWGLGLRSIKQSQWSNIQPVYPPAEWHRLWWQEHGGSEYSDAPRLVYEWSALGRHDLRMEQGGKPTSLANFYCYGLRAGFPLLSLEGVHWTDNRPFDESRPSVSDVQWLMFASGGLAGDGRGLPLWPLWPG